MGTSMLELLAKLLISEEEDLCLSQAAAASLTGGRPRR
jgi:hypothetical protein